jgi:lipopolysaccharide export LptBFGC system permease protein LptF
MELVSVLLYVLAALCFFAAAVRYTKVTLDLVALGLFFWVMPQVLEQLSRVL